MSIANAQANDKLAELRHKRKQAIEALDFAGAEECDRQIQSFQQSVTAERVHRIEKEMIKEFTQLLERSVRQEADFRALHKKQSIALKGQFDASEARAAEKHRKEMAGLDASREVALRREASREVPEQVELLDRAKGKGLDGDYQAARNLVAEAREVAANILLKRQETVDGEFAHSREVLEDRYQDARASAKEGQRRDQDQLAQELDGRVQGLFAQFREGVGAIEERARTRCDALLAPESVKNSAKEFLAESLDARKRRNDFAKEALGIQDSMGEGEQQSEVERSSV